MKTDITQLLCECRHCSQPLEFPPELAGKEAVLSPVTSKPASRGRIKTGHSEVLDSYQFSCRKQAAFQFHYACPRNAEVSDRRQPPMKLNSSLSELAGSPSLHRLVRCSVPGAATLRPKA
jgi:hypothetical protein